jgi:hypothetical protein
MCDLACATHRSHTKEPPVPVNYWSVISLRSTHHTDSHYRSGVDMRVAVHTFACDGFSHIRQQLRSLPFCAVFLQAAAFACIQRPGCVERHRSLALE